MLIPMSSRNKYELIITEPAMDDIEAIAAYTSIQWGEEQAVKYTGQLYGTITDIADNPDTGQSHYGVPNAIKGKKSGRHIVFYRTEKQTIFIMRILHESMDHGRYLL